MRLGIKDLFLNVEDYNDSTSKEVTTDKYGKFGDIKDYNENNQWEESSLRKGRKKKRERSDETSPLTDKKRPMISVRPENTTMLSSSMSKTQKEKKTSNVNQDENKMKENIDNKKEKKIDDEE